MCTVTRSHASPSRIYQQVSGSSQSSRATLFLLLIQNQLWKDEICGHQLIHVSTCSRIHEACCHTRSRAPDAAVRLRLTVRQSTANVKYLPTASTDTSGMPKTLPLNQPRRAVSKWEPSCQERLRCKTVGSSKPARLDININMPAPASAIAYSTKLLQCWSNKLQPWRRLRALTFKSLTGCATWQPKPR